MNGEYKERSLRGLINLFLIIVIVGVVAMWLIKNLGFETKSPLAEATEEITVSQTDEYISLTQAEWITIQNQLEQLQKEVNTLQSELSAKSATTTSAATNSKAATVKISALTLEKYTHDGDWMNASLSFKNNTTKTIKSFSGRIIYLDLNGNMLNYENINKTISIEPGYVKAIELSGYNWQEGYSYYKSEASFSHPDRQYQVRFELKAFKH